MARTDVLERGNDRGGVRGRAAAGAHRRIAVCECGAQLAGDSRPELIQAVQSHVAHHHPDLLGALEVDVVMQMAEDLVGAPGA